MNLGVAQLYGARCGIAYECFEQALDVLAGERTNILRALASWSIKAKYCSGLREIQRGLEAAQAARCVPNKSAIQWSRPSCAAYVELLLAQLRVAIGDIRQAGEHARWALELAPSAGEVGRRIARLASLLVDAHDTVTADEAIDALFAEVKRNKSRFALYRTSLDVAVCGPAGRGTTRRGSAVLARSRSTRYVASCRRDEPCIADRHQRQAIGT